MIIGEIVQQPLETLDYDIDYTDLVYADGDTIVSITATVDLVTDPVLSVTAVVKDTLTGKIWVSGGVTGNAYTVTVTATSDDGRIKEDEFLVCIEETS